MTNIETTRSGILRGLTLYNIDDIFEVTDAPRKGWKNTGNTIVMKLRTQSPIFATSVYTGFYLAKIAHDHLVDEIDEAMMDKVAYFRLQFTCDHSTGHHFEDVEVDTMTNGEHDTYVSKVAVCDDCDAQLEGIDPPSDDDAE